MALTDDDMTPYYRHTLYIVNFHVFNLPFNFHLYSMYRVYIFRIVRYIGEFLI